MEGSAVTNRELLENVANSEVSPQYMIQRMTVEATPLLNLDGMELPHEPLPTLGEIGADDYMPVSYSADDLLSRSLTEEDRNLAAALVAVQLSQQQKLQLLQQDSNVIVNARSLPSLPHLGNKIDLKLIPRLSPILLGGTFYTTKQEQSLGRSDDEDTLDDGDLRLGRRDSDGDHRFDLKIAKKSLPHKKRISTKLKTKNCNVATTRKQQQQQHKCTLCELTFVTSDELNSHVLCHDAVMPVQTEVVFCCQLCASTFEGQLEFFEHLKQHYEPVGVVLHQEADDEKVQIKPEDCNRLLNSLLTLNCIECGKTFKRQRAYEAHIRDSHIDNKDEDFPEFSEPEDLMEGIRGVVEHHVQRSDNDDDDDDLDGDRGDSKDWSRDDELHATEADLRELEAQDHICHLCKRPFSARSMLLEHLVDCRNSASPKEEEEDCVVEYMKKKPIKKKSGQLNCSQCDRVFNHRNSLVYHMRSHSGERPHQCDICGRGFFAASALKVHMRLHSGDKPYKCEHCERHFRQWGDLRYHHISIHSDQKQYQCEYCGKDFARKYSLILHRRIHTGEKNYRCEYCDKTFRASTYLQNHRRIHTGEKPYPCEVCGKPFRVRSDMKRHLNTHSRKRVRPVMGMGATVDHITEEDIVVMNLETNENNETVLTTDADSLKEDDEQQPHAELVETTQTVPQTIHYSRETLESVRDGNTLYTQGHQLFIYCPPDTPIQTIEQTWIQTENS